MINVVKTINTNTATTWRQKPLPGIVHRDIPGVVVQGQSGAVLDRRAEKHHADVFARLADLEARIGQ